MPGLKSPNFPKRYSIGMNKKKKKFVNRIINRIYKHTKSDYFRLTMLNFATKYFVDKQNKIQYDRDNNIFWLKNNRQYLLAVDKPYFDFDKEKMDKTILNVFCLKYIPKKGDVIIDVGAGIGSEIGFFENKMGDNGKLFCIEASPSSFRKLELLKQKNSFKNCYTFNIAISNKNGIMWMQEKDNYRVNKINDMTNGIEIEVNTFDEFVFKNNIQHIDFLKANIEGAEYEMVDGMEKSIGIIDNIAVSCHDFLNDEEEERIRKKVERFLIKNNFELFYRNTGNKILDSWLFGKKSG